MKSQGKYRKILLEKEKKGQEKENCWGGEWVGLANALEKMSGKWYGYGHGTLFSFVQLSPLSFLVGLKTQTPCMCILFLTSLLLQLFFFYFIFIYIY